MCTYHQKHQKNLNSSKSPCMLGIFYIGNTCLTRKGIERMQWNKGMSESDWWATNYIEMERFLGWKLVGHDQASIKDVLHEFIEYTYDKGTLKKYKPSKGLISPWICTCLCFWLRVRKDKWVRRNKTPMVSLDSSGVAPYLEAPNEDIHTKIYCDEIVAAAKRMRLDGIEDILELLKCGLSLTEIRKHTGKSVEYINLRVDKLRKYLKLKGYSKDFSIT